MKDQQQIVFLSVCYFEKMMKPFLFKKDTQTRKQLKPQNVIQFCCNCPSEKCFLLSWKLLFNAEVELHVPPKEIPSKQRSWGPWRPQWAHTWLCTGPLRPSWASRHFATGVDTHFGPEVEHSIQVFCLIIRGDTFHRFEIKCSPWLWSCWKLQWYSTAQQHCFHFFMRV